MVLGDSCDPGRLARRSAATGVSGWSFGCAAGEGGAGNVRDGRSRGLKSMRVRRVESNLFSFFFTSLFLIVLNLVVVCSAPCTESQRGIRMD